MHIPTIPQLSQHIAITLFWFRRDLRIVDNHGLYQALKNHKNVLPIFIFDTNILDKIGDVADRRVNFIYVQIQRVKTELQKLHSSLCVCYGQPMEIYKELINRILIRAIYTNHDYEPYARERDQAVQDLFTKHHIPFQAFKDQIIFEKDEILKEDGAPYTVFTPYMKKWKAKLIPNLTKVLDTQPYFQNFLKIPPLRLLTLEDMGFRIKSYSFPSREIDIALIKQYDQQRNNLAIKGTSQLSVHLRLGTISIRTATRIALEHNEAWLNQLIWRNFYMMILWHFPNVISSSFKAIYDTIPWINNEQHFQAWCKGRTGYPLVDAGMQELNRTGYMHNRLRMITANFLTKHLLIDWRWGEAYFSKKLLDYELASNNGGWQWAAGSGCDAASYFRIFNPTLQIQKFDPNLTYIKKWNPRFQERDYPKPIVNQQEARERALKIYKKILTDQQG